MSLFQRWTAVILSPFGLWSAARRILRALTSNAHSWRAVHAVHPPEPLRPSLSSLPSELVFRILMEFDLHELMHVSQVSRCFRRLALDDLRFWRTIHVDSVDPRSLHLASLQISTAGKRPFRLSIDCTSEHRRVETDVLRLLASALPFVSELAVRINNIFILSLWDVLDHPAPNLQWFILQLYVDNSRDVIGVSRYPLQTSIFGGTSVPQLRLVSLENVYLPFDPIPSMSEVTVAHIMFHQDCCIMLPNHVFSVFPRLVDLRIGGHSIVPCASSDPLPARFVEGFSQLRGFEIVVNGDTMSWFFEHLPMDRIPDLYISCPEFDCVYDALSGLLTPLHLRLREFQETIWLSVYSTHTDRIRHFIDARNMYHESHCDPNPLLEDQAFANQLSSLMIDASIWSLMRPFLPDYPFISTLRLVIDQPTSSTEMFPHDAIIFPRLETLALHARCGMGNVNVDVDDLASFAERISICSLKLELVNVTLTRRHNASTARFVEIVRNACNMPRIVDD